MTNPKHLAYERLKELYDEAKSATYAWTDNGKAQEWRLNVQSALRRLYGAESEQLKAFNKIYYSPVALTNLTPDSAFERAFMSGITSALATISSAIREYEDYELSTPNSNTSLETSPSSERTSNLTRKIFVVHGHDNEMKLEVELFLKDIDFEPIILHKQASAGDTIIEKFERNADVSYAVVLLSPDDVGAAKDKQDSLQPRARQNVVLELGYFIGKLGRTHVFPLKRQSVEIPSDFSGVVYVSFEEDWKMKLIQELKHLGFEVDANKTLA